MLIVAVMLVAAVLVLVGHVLEEAVVMMVEAIPVHFVHLAASLANLQKLFDQPTSSPDFI